MKPIPCVDCITLSVCRALLEKSFIEDYQMLCGRCSLMREYLEYERHHKRHVISHKFFGIQDYLYLGKLHS